MKKIETTIPFCGFYESEAASMIDREIEQLFDVEGTGEGQVPDDFWMEYNSEYIETAFARAYSKAYRDWLNEELGLDIEWSFKLLDSPRAYNFATDRIFCEITIGDVQKIRNAISADDLASTIRERFTSQSGFISHYANNLNDWPENMEDWDHNQIGTLLEVIGEPPLWELMEDYQCNGDLANDVWEGLPDSAKKLVPDLV